MGGPTINIAIIARVKGNVNADGTVGQRILLKKMYSTTGETLPFVSARAIKRSILNELANMGYEVDPFIVGREGALDLSDSGDPVKYVDNDIFGYMYTGRGQGNTKVRQAPIAFSYLVALRDTPVEAEFGARFPREGGDNPGPFEVEVADFLGRLNVIVYDYVGDFTRDRYGSKAEKPEPMVLPRDERVRRVRDFLTVLLTPLFVPPRRTNSLSMFEYKVALIAFTEKGPVPIAGYLDIDKESKLDIDKLKTAVELVKSLPEVYKPEIWLIAYDKSFIPPEAFEIQGLTVVEPNGIPSLAETLAEKLIKE